MTEADGALPSGSKARLEVELVGGAGQMGGHHLVVDLAGDSFLVDFGMLFPGPDEPGIDRIVPALEPALSRAREGRLRALLLTHGHKDHIGAVAELLTVLPDLPVYGTAFTFRLLRRQFELDKFKARTAPDLRTVEQGVPVPIGACTATWYRVTHSLPSCSSLALSGGGRTVVHSGDFRVQQAPLLGEPSDVTGLTALGRAGVDVALVDSTNAGNPGRNAEESVVSENLSAWMAKVPGRAVVTGFSSQLERVVGVARAAAANGRAFAVYGRTLSDLVRQEREHGAGPLKELELVSVEQAMTLPPHRCALLVSGCQGEWRAPLARIARGEDPRVRLGPGDVVAWSARVIPGNERAAGLIVNRLLDRGVGTVPPWGGGPVIHSSGHARRDEVADWLSWVKPRWVVPLHGESWHLERHRSALAELGHPEEKVVRVRSGVRLSWDDDDTLTKTKLGPEAGTWRARTGKDLWSRDEAALRQRRKLAAMGSATVAVPWNNHDRSIVGPIAVTTLGVFAEDERDQREAELADEVALGVRELVAASGKAGPSLPVLQERARLALRAGLRRRTGQRTPCRAAIQLWPAGPMVENDQL